LALGRKGQPTTIQLLTNYAQRTVTWLYAKNRCVKATLNLLANEKS